MSYFRSRILSKISPMVAAVGLVTFAQSAQATIWNIEAVLTGANAPGFGASGFHDATGSNVMSGADLGDITFGSGSFGTYNDSTGDFSSSLSVAPTVGAANIFTLSGNLLFGGLIDVFGALEGPSTLDANFNGIMNTGGGGTLLANMTTIGFSGEIICCNDNGAGPNSFSDQGGGMAIITLWGANGFGRDNSGNYGYDGSTLGMDIQLKLTAVPLPAALPLFGTGLGLLGFLGWRRRRKAVAAA